MSPSSKIALIALAVSLVACAPKPYPPQPLTQVTDLSAATTPSASSASSTSAWVSTYPYGTAQGTTSSQPALATPPASIAEAPAAAPSPAAPAAPAPAPAATTQSASHGSSGGQIPTLGGEASEGVTVLSSEAEGRERLPSFQSGWIKPGTSEEQHRADIESCYRYAFAQVDHDLKIDSDVAAARDDGDKGLGFTLLTQRMNLYDLKRRRTELINDCMEGKGYNQT